MDNRTRIKHIWQYGKKYIGLFAVAEICIVVLYAVAVLLPLNLTFLTDEVLNDGKYEQLWTVIRNYILLFVVSCIFNLIYAFVWQTLSNQYVGDVKISLFDKIVHAKAAWLSSINSGDLMTRIDTDSDQFLNAIQRNLFHVVNSIIMCVCIIVIVCFIQPVVAIMLIITAVLPIILTRVLGSIVQKAAQQEAATNGAFQGRLFEILNAMKDVRLMSARKWADQKVCQFVQKLIKLRTKVKWLDFSTDKFIQFVNLITSLIIYFYCALLVSHGAMTIGIFLALLQYITLLHRKMNWILRLYLEWFGRKAGLDRVIEVLTLPGETQEAYPNISINELIESISFQNVCMVYDRNEILHNLSFEIRKGEKVAIVGYSGAGKTTIADLMVGLYDATSGSVCINGANVKTYDPKTLRSKIAVLSQQITLFKASIRENLLIGCSIERDYTDEELMSVCDSLELGDRIRQLSLGLDSVLGTDGFDMSGGQKQRLMIARMILRDPEVMILDEATSALDMDIERKVVDLLCERNEEMTLIVISHRVEAVERCDRAIVIYQGMQIAEGSPHTLKNKCDMYRRMFGEDGCEIITNTNI